MIISTDVEQLMVFTIVPADDLRVRFPGPHRRNTDVPGPRLLVQHCNEPASRGYCVRPEELDRSFCAHLRRNYAFEVILNPDFVDDGQGTIRSSHKPNI